MPPAKCKIQLRELVTWLGDQLSHPHTLFKRKTWGVFSVYAHVRRSDHRPKIASPTKEKALAVAKSMEEKYGGKYSIYKCLYCNGWHVAKELSSESINTESLSNISTIQVSNTLKIDKIAALNIPDFAPVYGGVRGRTMSSRYQSFAWPTIREAGIKTIIDLRADGVYSRLSELCKTYGFDYFYYPVDNRCENIESMVKLFPELCKNIDNGNFYIACAMGLHRTDIALCLYWVFYAADKGIAPPEIRGYRKDQGHNTDKIMRVINGFYQYIMDSTGKDPFSNAILKERKSIIVAQSKKTDNSSNLNPRSIVKKSHMTMQNKPITNSYQVDERIYAGEYARDLENPRLKVDAFVNFGITHFIDLTEDGELAPYQQLLPGYCTHFRFPIQDVSIPDDFQSVYELMLYIDKILAKPDNKIYIHCWGGVGRTGVIVGCYYVYRGEPYIKALSHLKENFKQCPKSNRRRTPETWSQEKFIKDFDHYKKVIEQAPDIK